MRSKRRVDPQTLHEERKYGFFWYDWLWRSARPILVGCAGLLLVCGIVLTGYNALGERFFFPVDDKNTTPIAFTVKAGSSLSTVAADLEAQGIVRKGAVLKYWMDFQGLSQKIQTGEYTLTKAMSVDQIIEQLTTGDGNPLTARITIIPGWTIENIADYLTQIGVAKNRQAVLDIANDAAQFERFYYVSDILKLPTRTQRIYLLEGYLMPDTYEIFTTATLESVIVKLLSQVEAVYPANAHARASELGMTMDQVLTLASMIEKEGKTADFAKVSAVFHGRLQRGMTLGSDVTVQYYTHSEKMALTTAQTSIASPYNTYQNVGLPVGPICSPSRAAVEAALYPDEQFLTDGYLYFCSTSPQEGTLVFSKTLEEHNTQVSIYRPLWELYDQERGV